MRKASGEGRESPGCGERAFRQTAWRQTGSRAQGPAADPTDARTRTRQHRADDDAAKSYARAFTERLAAAHEYLLARSATRSEEPLVVNGKRLPTEEELLKTRDADLHERRAAGVLQTSTATNGRRTVAKRRRNYRASAGVGHRSDPADRATIEEEHALELRTRDRERKLIKKVQQALARIESGEYGYCEETGDPIGIPRLLARPTATLSLEAQQRRELKQKMFGD
jgi:DnaK suppressor protein